MSRGYFQLGMGLTPYAFRDPLAQSVEHLTFNGISGMQVTNHQVADRHRSTRQHSIWHLKRDWTSRDSKPPQCA